ncbi:MAG: hypothetical protein NVS1B12_06830 [Acidimicrobiales bacterium]
MALSSPTRSGRPPLWRRTFAEFLGSTFLAAIVIGSGIAAQRLSPNDIGLQLLENATATAVGLVAIILTFGPVSGAHFNPVVSLADRVFGGVSTADVIAYVPAQIAGCCAGAILANRMFHLPFVELSTKTRTGGGLWLAEVVATVGLLLVIFALVRSGRSNIAPFAVGAYIGGAYFWTASTSFANPAIVVGRMLSNSFAGIKPGSAPAFVAFEVIGLMLAVAIIKVLYPDMSDASRAAVVPAASPSSPANLDRPASVPDIPEVLVVCTHNAGRSVAARVLLDHYGKGRINVRSAGSAPGDSINPAVAQILAERGLDATKEFPKPLTDEVARAADVIITMGCGDACPVYPGKKYLDWELTDPAGKSIDEVRPIIDAIDQRVRAFLAALVDTGTSCGRHRDDPRW